MERERDRVGDRYDRETGSERNMERERSERQTWRERGVRERA